MNLSSLAGHTIELIERVVRSNLPADRVIQDFYRERRYLGSHDRRWITERLYAVIRNFRLLREISGECVGHPLPVHIFLAHEIAVAEMGREELEESYETLFETYRMAGEKLDLDVLSGCIRTTYAKMKETRETDPLFYSFPDFFPQLLPEDVRDENVPLMAALNREARVCIRVDVNRISREEVIRAFTEEGIEARAAKYSPLGVYLSKRVNLNNNPLYKGGFIEVQEEASQLVGLLADSGKDEIVVDACAGAGGKSLEIAAMSAGGSRIYALDVDDSRLRNLVARAKRSGYGDISPIKVSEGDLGDAAHLAGTADKVIVDAPCSGSGTIRRNPDKKFRLTMESVEKYANHQRTILQRYADLVKIGGILIYSTCSIFSGENFGVIDSFLASDSRFTLDDVAGRLPGAGISDLLEKGCLATYPHRHDMDGFFAAVMKRKS